MTSPTAPKRSSSKIARTALLGATILIIAISSFRAMYQVGQSGEGFIESFIPNTPTPAQDDTSGPTPRPTTGAGELLLPEPWDGAERVTMLLMGLDYRDWSAGEDASRSDTMILLTIDPVTKNAGILSVPRDLWVTIPGFSAHKINVAYYYGEAYNLPGGGPALAMQTVEQTIGIEIDYFAQIDFGTFVRFIDLIGGVPVDVPERIKVHPIFGDQITVWIEPGFQTLTGDLALAYARVRNEEGGDFARAERQQLVILGLRNRLSDPKILASLIADSGSLYAELENGINTNLPLDDAIQLAVLAMQVDPENIARGVIDERYVTFGRSPDDLSILIPNPGRIRELRDQIFGGETALSPFLTGLRTDELVAIEQAEIAIRYAAGYEEVAQETADWLTQQGIIVINVSQADNNDVQTTITTYKGYPYTLGFLLDILRLNNRYLYHDYIQQYPYDIEIHIGRNWDASNPMK